MEHTDIGARNAPTLPDDLAADGGSGPTASATDTARETADEAREQAKNVAGTAVEGAHDVAQVAKHQAAQVGTEVKEQGKDLAHEARSQLRDQAQSQTGQIAGKLREIGDEIRALADGRPEQATNVRSYAEQAAGKISDLAGHVESRGFDGVIDDVKSFARRRPGAFLAGTAVAGFAVGRLFRNTSGSSQPSEMTSTRSASTSYVAPSMATPQTTGLTVGPPPTVEGPAQSRGDLPTTELPTGLV